MPEKATAKTVDFSNVKDAGDRFKKLRQPQGDYKGQVVKVVDSPTKTDNADQWVYTISVGPGTYPYRCKLVESQFWKIRNLLIAAGVKVPQKKVKVDPNLVVGKFVGVTLEDDEYNDRAISEVNAVFPISELSGDVADADDDDEEEDEDEEVEAPPVRRPAKKAAAAPAPVEDDDEEEDEDEEEEEEPPPPPVAKKSSKAERARKRAAAAKAKPAPVEDDDDEDLEEIDIDDI